MTSLIRPPRYYEHFTFKLQISPDLLSFSDDGLSSCARNVILNEKYKNVQISKIAKNKSYVSNWLTLFAIYLLFTLLADLF